MSDSPDVSTPKLARAGKTAKRQVERDSQITETVLESTNEGFVVWDAKLKLVAWSKKCPDFWYEPEDILRPGMPMVELLRHIAINGGFGPGDPDKLAQKELRRIRKAGKDSEDEFQMRDGRIIHVQRNTTSDGGHASTYTDITERRGAETALRASEEHYRSLVEGSIQGVAIDRDGVPIFANQAYADIFGYDSPDEIVELGTLAPLYEPDERDRVIQYRENRMAGRQPAPERYEFNGVKKDGSKICLETRLHMVTWQGGPAIQSTVIDITELQTAKEARERLSQAIETVPVGIALFDSDDRLTFFNNRYRELMEVMADILEPGVTFEKMIRTIVERQPVKDALGREEEFIQERINHHRNPTGPFDIRREDRWLMANETRLVNGNVFTIISDITERKQAEEELQTSEQRFRTLFHQSPLGVSVEDYSQVKRLIDRLSGEGVDDFLVYFRDNTDALIEAVNSIRLIDANETQIEMYGTASFDEYKKYEQGYDLTEDDEWREFYVHELATFASGGVTYSGETADFLADSTPIKIRCVSRIVESANEDWSEVISTHEDITERKREEIKRLKEAQQLAKIGNWCWSIGTDSLISCSDEFAALHGISMDEIHDYMSGQPAKNVHPDDRDRVIAEYRRVDEEGVDYQIDYRIVRPDGETRHVVEIGKAVHDNSGRVVEHTGTTQDITEQKRAEEALRETLVWLEEAQRVGQVGHWVWDEIAEKHLFVSHEHCRIFGNEDNPKSNTWDEFLEILHPDDRERVERELIEASESRTSYESEYRIVYPNGEICVVIERGEPVFDAAGSLIRTVGTVQDITERKKVEEALREAHDNLEQRVEERTQELQESEERNRNFAADAAHELRTPLAVFRTHLDNLPEGSGREGLRREVDRMARLVEQLLSLARIDAGKIGSSDTVNLHTICVDVAAHLAPAAIKASRSVEVVGSDGPVNVRGISAALEMAIRNVVENAIKYSNRGSTVTIELSDDATIRIIDNGPGIPVRIRETVFDRFIRADQRESGSGLGLAIVQSVVQAHGGSVEIDDNPEGGAVVTISLPSMQSPVTAEG